MKPLSRQELVEHPEGGRFLEVYRSACNVTTDSGSERTALTHIYFSLRADEVSRFHKVASDEIWNLYEGEGLLLYVWDDAAQSLTVHELSASRNTYCCVVEAGKWQAAEPLSDEVLVGCSVAPGFEFNDFEMINPKGDVARQILKESPELFRLI